MQIMFERLENELAITKRHLSILAAVAESEPVGLVTLTNRLSYPMHKIRYSLRILKRETLVQSTAAGFTTTDHTSDGRTSIDRQLTAVAQRLEQVRIDRHPFPTVPTQPATSD